MLKPIEFIKRSLHVVIFALLLFLLDIFMPIELYSKIGCRIFKVDGIIVLLVIIIGNLIYLKEIKE